MCYNINVGQRKSKSKIKYQKQKANTKNKTTKSTIYIEKRRKKVRISDMIEEFIKEMFNEENSIEIQRNDLAEKFNCVPSQINYVISTRFKPAQGYYVESKRGGGGHITITKVNITKSNYLMHIISSIGETISAQDVSIFISNFLSYDMITQNEAKLLKVATSDNVIASYTKDRDSLRANIFKNMLLNLVED